MKKVKESINGLIYGLPDELGEKLSDALEGDNELFYRKLVEALDKTYNGNALDCLSQWYDQADSINSNYPTNNYPWFDEDQVDLWGDGVMLGGELADVDILNYDSAEEPDRITDLFIGYVDHADTDFWKFLYENWDGFEDFLDEVNGFALVKENKMKKINENAKVTLTLGQLKKLVRESQGDPQDNSYFVDVDHGAIISIFKNAHWFSFGELSGKDGFDDLMECRVIRFNDGWALAVENDSWELFDTASAPETSGGLMSDVNERDVFDIGYPQDQSVEALRQFLDILFTKGMSKGSNYDLVKTINKLFQ